MWWLARNRTRWLSRGFQGRKCEITTRASVKVEKGKKPLAEKAASRSKKKPSEKASKIETGSKASRLIIVESPTKAKMLGKWLSKSDYEITSSQGHVFDLPQSADQVPSEYKGKSWARIGIDLENGAYTPLYLILPSKVKVLASITELVHSLQPSLSEIILATDADREGESIAWHLARFLDHFLSSGSSSDVHLLQS